MKLDANDDFLEEFFHYWKAGFDSIVDRKEAVVKVFGPEDKDMYVGPRKLNRAGGFGY